MSKHTPTPWAGSDEDPFNTGCRAFVADGEPVTHVETWANDNPEGALANAEFIARSSDAHEELV